MKNNESFTLFGTGFVQVFLVGLNTYLIAKEFFLGIFCIGFCISYVWSINVKKIVLGTKWDRFMYSLGAGFGSVCGAFVAKWLILGLSFIGIM